MKKVIIFLVVVILSFVLTSCEAKEQEEASAFEKVHKQLTEMKTYSCVVGITQNSNKGSKEYEVKQFHEMSGRYRMEIVSPEKVAGSITIFDGKSIMQFNPRVEGSLRIDVPPSQIRNELFLGQFVKNYLQSEGVAVSVANLDGANTTVLEAIIPGDHPYMQTEKLWVDNETFKPIKMVIYDKDEKEIIIVNYREFEYNVTLEDSQFSIK